MSEGVENLFSLMKASGAQQPHDHFMDQYHSGALKYADLKEEVANALVAMTKPFIERKAELNADKKNLKNQIKQSSWEIRQKAQQTIKEVKELVGLMNVRF
jgi:tryptophanyl-tRNA synthetase